MQKDKRRGVCGRWIVNGWLYDQVQAFFGLRQTRQVIAPHLADESIETVLDVGAGTALYRSVLPEKARYIWSDINAAGLGRARARFHEGDLFFVGDACHCSLRSQSVDVALCVALSHHLTDGQLQGLLDELHRVTRQKLVFLDALDIPASLLSNLMWKCDRGAYPRALNALTSAIQGRFQVEHTEQFRSFHQLWLCVGRPKRRLE